MSVEAELLIALRRILRATDLDGRRLAKVTGLSTSQLLVLRTIDAHPGVTVGEIANEVSLRQATVTVLVDRLEARALVVRRRKDSDRRMVEVRLTTTGRGLIEDAPTVLQHRFLDRLEALQPWEKSALLSALQRVAEMLDAGRLDAAPILDSGTIVTDDEPRAASTEGAAEPR